MSNSKYGNPFSATLNGILDLFRKQEPIGSLRENERLDGKVCLVTGSNSGLGKAIAIQMAERGATVYMACRSGIPEAGQEVGHVTGSKKVHMLPIDLTDVSSIYRFIEEVALRKLKFDIAIFNAAMVPSGSKKTTSGLDEMFLVNYLSKFILVNGLIERGIIEKNAVYPPRVIFTNSESHRTNQAIDFINLGKFEPYSMGKVIQLYGYYKLLLNVFAKELSRRLNHKEVMVSVHSFCPGPVNSNIARQAPRWSQPILKVIFGLFFSTPKKAAAPAMYLSCAEKIAGQTDIYLHLMQQKEMDEKAIDADNGKKLWEKSQAIVASLGVD